MAIHTIALSNGTNIKIESSNNPIGYITSIEAFNQLGNFIADIEKGLNANSIGEKEISFGFRIQNEDIIITEKIEESTFKLIVKF